MAICAHCEVQINDPTTQVVHGDLTYCCPNCAAAVEQSASGGSDPKPLTHANNLRCTHCGCAIVDESTMESRGDQAFCCANCAAMATTS